MTEVCMRLSCDVFAVVAGPEPVVCARPPELPSENGKCSPNLSAIMRNGEVYIPIETSAYELDRILERHLR